MLQWGGGFGGRIEEKISGPITTNEQTVRGDTKLVMTNSNGGDVMSATTAVEYKMGQNQKDTSGGYVLSIGNGQAAEASDTQEEVCQTLNCMHETQKICKVTELP